MRLTWHPKTYRVNNRMKSIELTPENPAALKKVLTGKVPVLMFYRLEGCYHCIEFKSTWDKIKTELEKNDGILCAEIEFNNMNKMLPAQLQVSGFPGIQIIEKGKVKAGYSGYRSYDEIVVFANTYAVAPSKPKPKAKATGDVAKPKAKKAKKPTK